MTCVWWPIAWRCVGKSFCYFCRMRADDICLVIHSTFRCQGICFWPHVGGCLGGPRGWLGSHAMSRRRSGATESISSRVSSARGGAGSTCSSIAEECKKCRRSFGECLALRWIHQSNIVRLFQNHVLYSAIRTLVQFCFCSRYMY